jgi:hypothetical protein
MGFSGSLIFLNRRIPVTGAITPKFTKIPDSMQLGNFEVMAPVTGNKLERFKKTIHKFKLLNVQTRPSMKSFKDQILSDSF